MLLINFEINLILNRYENCVIAIKVTKLYVLKVTLSTQDNAKLLEQLKSFFFLKKLTGISIYQKLQQKKRQNLDSLIDPSFQGV